MNRSIRNSILLGVSLLPAGAVLAQAPDAANPRPAGTVEQRLERVERMLQSQGLLEILQQVQQLQQDINSLRGEIETHNYNLDQLSRRQRDLYADIDQRLQRLEGGTSAPLDMTGATATDGTAAATPPLETLSGIAGTPDQTVNTPPSEGGFQVEVISNAPEGQPGTATSPNTGLNTAPPQSMTVTPSDPSMSSALPGQIDPAANGMPVESTTTMITPAPTPTRAVSTDPVQLQAEYQQAFNLLRQQLYDQAIKAFQQFLTDHPNDRYSDSAQYWLAEAFYVKRDFQPALDEYNKLVVNFPESQKVADASLKIGFTMIELGQIDNAREHLQNLIRQQPDSTAARLADERLKQLGSATQQTLPPAVN